MESRNQGIEEAVANAIIDSDILIDALKDSGGTADRLAAYALSNGLYTTAVNVFEVVRGLSEAASEAGLALLREFEVLPFDADAAARAAETYQQLRRAGTLIDTGDLLIAGVALSRGMTVITRNQRDFQRISGLELSGLPA